MREATFKIKTLKCNSQEPFVLSRVLTKMYHINISFSFLGDVLLDFFTITMYFIMIYGK